MQYNPLLHYLEPLRRFLEDIQINEISLNRPKEIYVEKNGDMKKYHIPEFDLETLLRFSRLVANYNHQTVSTRKPLLSARLPKGYRIQIIMPPVSEFNPAFSIRKQVHKEISLDDYSGSYRIRKESHVEDEDQLNNLLTERKYSEFIKMAIQHRLNLLISGGTGSGKTTFLNACISEFPSRDRIITLEDTREITVPHQNKVHLVSFRGTGSATAPSMIELLEASLRLRPDRIILGEIRGVEAATYIEAMATGHDGSVSTIHASNPKLALEQLAIKAERGGLKAQSRSELISYIKSIISVVIQLKRNINGERIISDIHYHN